MNASPTRQGWMVLVAAVAAVVVGRLFGVLELYVISAAMGLAVAVGLLVVLVRRPRIEVNRWIRPSVHTAGDVGRVEVLVQRVHSGRSPNSSPAS